MGMQDFIGKKQKKETERKTQYMYVCMYVCMNTQFSLSMVLFT